MNQLSRGCREEAHIAADRFPVHETVVPERSGAEASEQHSRRKRFLPDEVDRSGDFRVVEAAGFPVGGRKVARADADAADPFDFQDLVDVANRLLVFDLNENQRFLPGKFQITCERIAVVTGCAPRGESAFAAVGRIAAGTDGRLRVPRRRLFGALCQRIGGAARWIYLLDNVNNNIILS